MANSKAIIETTPHFAVNLRLNNAEFLANLREFLNRLLNILFRVRRGDLHSDARFAFGNDGGWKCFITYKTRGKCVYGMMFA